MGAIKSNQYTTIEQDLFLTARAFAHPARIKMMTILYRGKDMRNVDFCSKLNLSGPCVKTHIAKLADANLVELEYSMHHYLITLNAKGQKCAENFLKLVEDLE